MKITCLLLYVLLLFRSVGASATLEQFWPWVSPNPLAFGITYADVKKARPNAVYINLESDEPVPGKPFEGGFFERLPDRSVFGYSFFDDKFVAANWAAPESADTPNILIAVRKSLLQTCGEPIIGTSGRLKSRGGIARIVWEQYRPRIDHDFVITLRATSEDGVELAMVRESDARKRNIKITPPTYEEVVESVPASVQSEESPSVLIDLLEEARSGKLKATSESAVPQRETIAPASPAAQPVEAKTASRPEPPTPNEEPPSSPQWPVLAVVIVAAIGLLWLLLKRRS